MKRRVQLSLGLLILVGLSLVLTAALPVAAAPQPYKGKTLRVVLANHPWAEAIKPLIPEFEKETGINVNVEQYFEDQLTQKLSVELASGTSTIDVFMQRPLQEAKQFQKNGWYTDLKPFMDNPKYTPKEWDADDFFPAALQVETVKGRLTGIPIVTEQEIIYYRKDLFEKDKIKVPTTLEELEAAAKHFNDPDKGFYGFVARGQRSPAVTQFSSYLYSFGGKFNEEDDAKLNTPEAIKAFTFYGNMLRKYGPPGVLNMSWPQALAIFAQGKAAMYTDASVFYSNMLDPKQSVIGDKVGFAVFPAGPAGAKPYNVTSWGVSMTAVSKNKEAAWEFIKWATSKEITLRAQAKSVPSARSSAWESKEGVASFPPQLVQVIAKSGKIGFPFDRPAVIQVGAARDIVGSVIVAAINGEDVKAAANKANEEYQALLDKEK
ncbi:MAG: ABC transporter substrate-binding protein [Chitinophagales bacterium]